MTETYRGQTPEFGLRVSALPGSDPRIAVCTPGPLPTAVHAKFTADLLQLLDKPALRGKLEEQGIDVTAGTPEQFVAHVRKETERWTKVVKAAGLGPE